MTGQPLPDFLADLAFTIQGKPYQMFPIPKQEGWFILGFKDDGYYNHGLTFNPEAERAEIKSSCDLKIYWGGETRTHTQWDDCEPDWEEADPFEEWIRKQVKKDIDRQLGWHLERVFRTVPRVYTNPELYAKMCEDFADLPNFEFTHWRNKGIKYSVLGAIHRTRTTNHISDEDLIIFEQFADALQDNEMFEHDRQQFRDIMTKLMPFQPDSVDRKQREEIKNLYTGMETCTIPPEYMQYKARVLKSMTAEERKLHHPYILKLCQSAVMCHTMAAGVFDFPEEAAPYIEKGLGFEQESVSLLMMAETFYLTHNDEAKLVEVRERIQAMDINVPDSNDIQSLIDRYTHLCNDYQYYRPKTEANKTSIELLNLEAQLNDYWFGILPDKKTLSRPVIEKELIFQQRFLSSGSANVFGWMRNNERFQLVVDFMKTLCDNPELCVLRHKSNPHGFEALINNGLSCFLDSKNKAHIKQGLKLVDALDSLITDWTSEDPYYAFACITARANLPDRTIEYAKRYEQLGGSVTQMYSDDDFENVQNHPTFKAMMKAAFDRL